LGEISPDLKAISLSARFWNGKALEDFVFKGQYEDPKLLNNRKYGG
jgi:hypothetical protein